VPLLLLGCSCSVSAQNQGKRAKVHFVLIFSQTRIKTNAKEAKRNANKNLKLTSEGSKNKQKCKRGQEVKKNTKNAKEEIGIGLMK
jgi:hypothetical protein